LCKGKSLREDVMKMSPQVLSPSRKGKRGREINKKGKEGSWTPWSRGENGLYLTVPRQ